MRCRKLLLVRCCEFYCKCFVVISNVIMISVLQCQLNFDVTNSLFSMLTCSCGKINVGRERLFVIEV